MFRNYFQQLQLYSRSLLSHGEFISRLIKRCSHIDSAKIAFGLHYKYEEIGALSRNMGYVPIMEVKFDVVRTLNARYE